MAFRIGTLLCNVIAAVLRRCNPKTAFECAVKRTHAFKHSLRSQMGLMLQDSFIFSGTIADNIRYGKLDATDSLSPTIKSCSRIMYLDDGRIMERGTRKDLMEKKGFYYRLSTSQYDNTYQRITHDNPSGKPERQPCRCKIAAARLFCLRFYYSVICSIPCQSSFPPSSSRSSTLPGSTLNCISSFHTAKES